eukprot:TRINITY_DN46148_c0_g1_i1.p1 TRINITY_DN46148_c0_g1~~TRINITY_DN46148_c0_g1_i1.p1  ORF type:complete len:115 (+),score=10.55 TRINITY_DN46148_c0_g1_i1:424-768(+)
MPLNPFSPKPSPNYFSFLFRRAPIHDLTAPISANSHNFIPIQKKLHGSIIASLHKLPFTAITFPNKIKEPIQCYLHQQAQILHKPQENVESIPNYNCIRLQQIERAFIRSRLDE